MRYTAMDFLCPGFAKEAERYILPMKVKPKAKPKKPPVPPDPDGEMEELAKRALAEACRGLRLDELTKKAAAYS